MPTLGPQKEKWLLVATVLASSMAFIDSSALNVALPAIQRDFEVKGKALLWIVNAYTLFLSALMLIGGALGDHFGRKRIFIVGIALFSLGSLSCGLTPNIDVLIASRAVQGVGGALMVPGSLSIIAALIPRERRGRAYGIWSTFSALTTVIGPVLGGWLAGAGLWRMIFFINLPLAAVSAVLLARKAPETKMPGARALDIQGAVLATLGLAGLTFGFIEAPERGWTTPEILIPLSAGAVALAGFLWREQRASQPMMPLKLFRNRTFSGVNLLTFLVYGALSASLFFVPLNLVQVQGYSEMQAGLAILPFAGLISLMSRASGWFTDRYGSRIPLIAGPLVTGAGFWLLSLPELTAGPPAYWSAFFPAFLTLGIGMGITVAPLTTAVMNAVGEEHSGVASGVNNAISRTAGLVAIAVLGAAALLHFSNELMEQAQSLGLNSGQLDALSREASELAEARPPESLSAGRQQQVQQMIRQSFADTFQLATRITAFMAWAAALVAWMTVEETAGNPGG